MLEIVIGGLLLLCSVPCGWFGVMVGRNVILDLRAPPQQRMASYGFLHVEFHGWQMYAFPLACVLLCLTFLYAGLLLLAPRRDGSEDS